MSCEVLRGGTYSVALHPASVAGGLRQLLILDAAASATLQPSGPSLGALWVGSGQTGRDRNRNRNRIRDRGRVTTTA